MKSIKAVLYGKPFKCPCCGSSLVPGITLRLRGKEIEDRSIDEYPPETIAGEDEDARGPA